MWSVHLEPRCGGRSSRVHPSSTSYHSRPCLSHQTFFRDYPRRSKPCLVLFHPSTSKKYVPISCSTSGRQLAPAVTTAPITAEQQPNLSQARPLRPPYRSLQQQENRDTSASQQTTWRRQAPLQLNNTDKDSPITQAETSTEQKSSGDSFEEDTSIVGSHRRPSDQLVQRPQLQQPRHRVMSSEVDPLVLPTSQYQPSRDEVAARRRLLSAITSCTRWEDVGLLAESQSMDAATLGAAMGHLQKLHKQATIGGKTSHIPSQIKKSGLLPRLNKKVVSMMNSSGEFPGRDIQSVLLAYGNLGFHPGDASLASFASAVNRNLLTFSPNHIANTVRAFAQLRFRPADRTLAHLADAAALGSRKLSPYNVGSLLWGYASLGAHPGGTLLQALERHLDATWEKYKAAHLAEVAWGWGTLGHSPACEQRLLEGIAATSGKEPPFGFKATHASTALSGLAKILQLRRKEAANQSGHNGCTVQAYWSTDSDAFQVLQASIRDGATDLNATQQAQALFALAEVGLMSSAAVQPLCHCVIATSDTFPPTAVCKALLAFESLTVSPAEKAAPQSRWPSAAPGGTTTNRLRSSVLRTMVGNSSDSRFSLMGGGWDDVEDDSKDAFMRQFVRGLSIARQSLAEAESLADESLSSGDDDPGISAFIDENGAFVTDASLLGFQLPEQYTDEQYDSTDTAGFPVDGMPLSSRSVAGPDYPTAIPAAQDATTAAASLTDNGSSSDSYAAVLGDSGGVEGLPSLEATNSLTHQALTALVRQLRLTVRRFQPPAILSALRSLEALSRPGTNGGPPFVVGEDITMQLASYIEGQKLHFTRGQQSEAAALLDRLEFSQATAAKSRAAK